MKLNYNFNAKGLPLLISGVILNLQLCSLTAFAADAPAQTPLVIAQSGVAPNIMLMFDDSSSMASMHPSDSGYQIWVTYHPDDIGSTYSGYRNRVYYASSNTDDLLAAGTRSYQLNSLYYNPAVTYKPWAKPNGELMPNLDPAAVPMYITAPDDYPKMDFTFKDRTFYFTGGTSADITAGLAPYHRYLYQYPNGGISSTGYRGNYSVQSPAMYFIYHGPDADNPNLQVNLLSNPNLRNINNYTPVVITEIGSGGITQPASRTDCAVRNSDGSAQCSREEELQNFVNWFGYYRGRTRTAIAALTHVFAKDFGMQYRLGWGAFNQGGATIAGRYYNYLKQGVKAYEGDHAEAFYAWLRNFERNTPGNTPTRAVLDAAGQYYSNADNRGPWGAKPGENDTTPHLACRRSYSIVMTDGGWNGADASTNLSGYTRQMGALISGPGGQSYAYMPKAPYEGPSTRSSTYLSDVALYYWSRDLRPDLPNIVVPTNEDEAFWQHMVTHTIGYGTTGSLKETDWPGLLAGTKSWGTNKFDDLWHAAVTGHGTFSSASNIENLVDSLSSIMQNMALQQIAAPHRVSSSQYLETSNRTYIPSYQTALWTGELTSYTMGNGGGLGTVEWRATDRLTEANAASRNIWVGTSAGSVNSVAEFKWDALASEPAIQHALNDSENLLRYLRGEKVPAPENYRERISLLGDIVNSTPVFAKKRQNMGYSRLPNDATNGAGGYSVYLQNMNERAGVVFVGANDGMLHAFATEGDDMGKEIFAYIPHSVVSNLPALATEYYENTHRYFVDGPLTLTDVFWKAKASCNSNVGVQNCWRNILLGSTGAGAKSVFALDVTDPKMYSNSPKQSTMNEIVLWELTPNSPGMEELGYVMQPIEAGYSASGEWVGIFGNGPYSASDKAVLFVVNLETGAVIASITAGKDIDEVNGLMGVTLIRDGNQVITGAYAGDLQGNLWRFDLSSSNPEVWSDAGNVIRLFTTDNKRAITHPPAFTEHPLGGRMVLFGTGKFYDVADSIDTNTDYLYGIRDLGHSVSASSLFRRTATSVSTSSGEKRYVVDDSPMDWETQNGWSLELTMGSGQRNLYKPSFLGSTVVFSTTLTGNAIGSGTESGTVVETCEVQGLTGLKVMLNAFSGRAPSVKTDTNGDGIIDDSDDYYISFPTDGYGPGDMLINPGLGSGNPEFNMANCASGALLTLDGVPFCAGAQDSSTWSYLF